MAAAAARVPSLKVFVTGADLVLGHNVSRVLHERTLEAQNPVEVVEGEGEEDEEREDEGQQRKKGELRDSFAYEVRATRREEFQEAQEGIWSEGVTYGDKDVEGREELGKLARIGWVNPEWVTECWKERDRAMTRAAVMASDVVILDFLGCPEDSEFVLETLEDNSETFGEGRKLVLGVSSVGTWGNTKPLEKGGEGEEEFEGMIMDAEFRRRRPLKGFRGMFGLEKRVAALGRLAGYRGFVICAGIVCHASEGIFHTWFKQAWTGESIPCYGTGQNHLPLIHLDDLLSIITHCIEHTPPTPHILAIDESQHTLGEVLKAIAETAGRGLVEHLPKDEVVFDKSVPDEWMELLGMDLVLKAVKLEEMELKWRYKEGFCHHREEILRRFKHARNLFPIAVHVVDDLPGQPGMASEVAEYYKLPYVSVKNLLEEELQKMREDAGVDETKVEGATTAEADSTETDHSGSEHSLPSIEEITTYLQTQPYPPMSLAMCRLVRLTLTTFRHLTHGYLLDGPPLYNADAQSIFAPASSPSDPQPLIPTAVFLPLTESEHSASLNNNNSHIQSFYDTHEVLTYQCCSLEKAIKAIGRPRGYLPAVDEWLAKLQEQAESEERMMSAQAVWAEGQDRVRKHIEQIGEWTSSLSHARQRELEHIELKSLPLKAYLGEKVLPVLTKGLVEVCQARPEDPIEYLVEYLFRHNPKTSPVPENLVYEAPALEKT